MDETESLGSAGRRGRWLGLAVFTLIWFCPPPEGLPAAAQRLAAIAGLMAVWWVTNAFPIAVVSLLPLVLFPLLGIQSAKSASGAYFSDSSCLYLGGFIIALGIEKWGLHRRMALVVISILGSSPKRIVLGFLLATFLISMWMSNTATTLVMLPIATSLLASLAEYARPTASPSPLEGEGGRRPDEGVIDATSQDSHALHSQSMVDHPLTLTLSPTGARGPSQNASCAETAVPGERGENAKTPLDQLASAVLLGIAYAASIGGVTTLVGTPTNIVFGDLWIRSFPEADRISAGEWMFVWVPFGLAFLAACWGLLAWNLPPMTGLVNMERSFFRTRLRELGPMSAGERLMALLFFTAALLWMFRIDFRISDTFTLPGWGDWVIAGLRRWGVTGEPHILSEWVSDATVGMTIALAMFLIPVPTSNHTWQPLMDWRTASKLPWEILLLFGGGFALADAFRTTGLAEWVGEAFSHWGAGQPAWLLVTVVCLLLVFMTEFTTNVATVNAVLPILASASIGLGVDPRLLMIPATISASCGFMLPIGTPPNAIVFGTGKVSAGRMARVGLAMNLIGVVLTVLATFFLLVPQQRIDLKSMPAWAKPSAEATRK